MKFHQIPLGTHFEWKGESYAKHSPVAARRLSDSKQFIVPRSAEVLIPGAARTSDPVPAAGPDAVEAAVRDYCRRCDQGMQQLGGLLPAETFVPIRDELERARAALFEILANDHRARRVILEDEE
ncbi:MAG: hypothetical protein A2514_04645 [Gammaproteobacteria bacterium RIFOXYD12_FULL_61_37]|nr:MAG: hypothetical protein A2514_04645 [Gammaproteobacteria bacterium RIFOXYD12_FULL_61_37]